MKLSKAQIIEISNKARANYNHDLAFKAGDTSDTFKARCWLNAIAQVLSKSNEELYVFPKNYNDGIVDPSKFIDVSGKLEVD